jgi:hypothetical protein
VLLPLGEPRRSRVAARDCEAFERLVGAPRRLMQAPQVERRRRIPAGRDELLGGGPSAGGAVDAAHGKVVACFGRACARERGCIIHAMRFKGGEGGWCDGASEQVACTGPGQFQ